MSSRRLILLSIFLAFGSEALAQICSTEPTEARKLLASGGAAVRLSWLAPIDTGGSSTTLYDVLRSASPSFSGAQCLASGIPTLLYDDIGFTGTGYYLIRSRNAEAISGRRPQALRAPAPPARRATAASASATSIA